jgi:alpha-amylase
MKRIPFLKIALMLLVAGFAHAQSTTVQFLVNMNYQIEQGNFNPATQTVDIAGSFNNWGTPVWNLTDTDADGIYTGSTTLTIGEAIQFKTRINGLWNGTEEFSGGGPNRSYTVMLNGVVEYWYNDEIPVGTLVANATPSAYVSQPGQQIIFTDQSLGTPTTWQWSFPGGTPATSTAQSPAVTYSAEGLYNFTLTVTDADGNTSTKAFGNIIRIDAMQTFWWNETVFYEAFVRSFKDSNGDGKGDIQGLISKLDYLNDGNPNTTTDLGITGLWLMPIMQSPSYHGYDVIDYETIEQDYGTNADFQQLITECHNRGIKVIIDMVMNHTSNQHPWFVSSTNPDSDKRDWYIWEESDPNTPGPFGNDPWVQYGADWYYAAFANSMPDLNFNNPEVHQAFEDVAEFWLTDMDVDGFRLDAVKYLYETATQTMDATQTIAYWQEFRAFYKSVNPDAFAVGEAWDVTSIASQYVNNNGLDYCFEFELADAIVNGLNAGSAQDLNNQMTEVISAYPFLQWGTILGNHDTNRVMSQFGSDMPKMKAAATLLLTLPGIPYIYYGEEIGMTGVKPDENLRTPMQWTGESKAGFTTGTPWYAINTDYTTKNVATQQATAGSLWKHYHDLIALRNSQGALTKGTYLPATASSTGVNAFVRQFEGENILVVVNLGSAATESLTLSINNGNLPSGNMFLQELLGAGNLEITIDGTGGFSNYEMPAIPARGYRIYKIVSELGVTTPQAGRVTLYPNPASGSIKLTTNATGIDIYNMAGQKVKSYKNYTAGQNLDVSTLTKGVYLVKVGNGKSQSTLKLIKE